MALGGSRFCYFCHMESATSILHNLEWDRYNHTGVRRILELAHIDLILLPLLFIVSVPLVRLNTQRRVQVSRLGITPLTLTLTPDDTMTSDPYWSVVPSIGIGKVVRTSCFFCLELDYIKRGNMDILLSIV